MIHKLGEKMPSKQIILGLSGKRGAGKTLSADYLVANYAFKKISFADKLRDYTKDMWDLKQYHFTPSYKERPQFKNGETVRDFMIDLGELMRYYDVDYWLKAPKIADQTGNIVVDDVRFQNEADYIKELGGKIIRINRYEKLNIYGKDLDIPSETALDKYSFEYIIEDCVNTTKESLYGQLDHVIKHVC